MGQRQDIIAEIARLQAQLATLNRVTGDTFNFGTVMLFVSGSGGSTKWYYSKTGEETWRNVKTNEEKDLASWILDAHEANIGYFEVYEMRPQPVPFYASA